MVLQDTWLFDGTIAENIAYGKPDATREEIEAAARAAHVDFFVRTLPEAGLVRMEKVGTMNFYSADVDSAMWARFAALAVQVGDALARARAHIAESTSAL